MSDVPQQLRRAIENLIDAKLLDAVGKPGGLDRLLAHRRTGVASFDIRAAEKKLDEALQALVPEGEAAKIKPLKPDVAGTHARAMAH